MAPISSGLDRALRTTIIGGLLLVGLTSVLAQSNYVTSYLFTTFAGAAAEPGSADGPGSAARFSYPSAVAVDSTGNLYVADWGNSTIRKITSAGVVSTIAGSPGVVGWADGTGSAARFRFPTGIAVDASGNVYVADFGNNMIRKITAAGEVTTLAGTLNSSYGPVSPSSSVQKAVSLACRCL